MLAPRLPVVPVVLLAPPLAGLGVRWLMAAGGAPSIEATYSGLGIAALAGAVIPTTICVIGMIGDNITQALRLEQEKHREQQAQAPAGYNVIPVTPRSNGLPQFASEASSDGFYPRVDFEFATAAQVWELSRRIVEDRAESLAFGPLRTLGDWPTDGGRDAVIDRFRQELVGRGLAHNVEIRKQHQVVLLGAGKRYFRDYYRLALPYSKQKRGKS